MSGAIDSAGRVVIPKHLRDELGFVPGPVEIERDGAGVRIVPVVASTLERVDDRLVIPRSGEVLDDGTVRELRDADRRTEPDR